MLSRGIFSGGGLCGIVGTDAAQWDTAGARAIGAAFAQLASPAGDAIVLGHDMRPSSAEIARAVAEGALSRGADVVDLGLCSTDQVAYSSGVLEVPAVMVTGGHQGPDHNGLLLWQSGAVRVDDTFLSRLAALAERRQAASPGVLGSITTDETLLDFASHLRSLIDPEALEDLHVVVDAGNGMAALSAPVVLGDGPLPGLGLQLEMLNQVLDGTFPQHDPNPARPASLVQAAARVRTGGAHLGLVFDGDGDRCAVLDETGALVPDEAVLEIVGADPSADLFGAPSGLLTALRLMECLGLSDEPLSALVARCARSSTSGEIDLSVRDADAALRAVGEAFEHHHVQASHDLGLSLSGQAGSRGGWQAELRPGDAPDGLRLTVEAADRAVMEAVRDDLCSILAAVA